MIFWFYWSLMVTMFGLAVVLAGMLFGIMRSEGRALRVPISHERRRRRG